MGLRNFTVETDEVALPSGAFAQARRVKVGWRGRAIMALSQGPFRAYVYPIFTPAGVAATGESPIDHPHHQSLTLGTDHVRAYLPLTDDKVEEAHYNFYVNATFQGRAPGRIIGTTIEGEEVDDDHLRLVQDLEWRGPREWGAADGRVVLQETRTFDVRPGELANVVELRSRLAPTDWDVRIGPTRHAYFTVRMADGLRLDDGAVATDSEDRTGPEAIDGHASGWLDCTGDGPHGRKAGVALSQIDSAKHPWHLFAFGTMTLNPFVTEAVELHQGESWESAVRVLAHDGDADKLRAEGLLA